MPRQIIFKGEVCYVASDDCTKLYSFDSGLKKPKVLDIVYKNYGQVLDMSFSTDSEQLYVVDH